jgi:hypothetical protein
MNASSSCELDAVFQVVDLRYVSVALQTPFHGCAFYPRNVENVRVLFPEQNRKTFAVQPWEGETTLGNFHLRARMDSGTFVGVFLFGAAVGALLEALVRFALRNRIKQNFIDELEERARKRKG